MSPELRILTLCTGNVARSVMLGFMLETLADEHADAWVVRTAGTHVVAGATISPRTLSALQSLEELSGHNFVAHRSHELDSDDVEWADVILAAEADHVAYVRARFPDGSAKVVQLGSFCRHAPLDEPFDVQLAVASAVTPDDTLDVVDPAGGDQPDYDHCVGVLWDLAQVFATILDSSLDPR
jgi:protein-tyrosine-phosphatase